MPDPTPSPALETYETLAPLYDRFTAEHSHEAWLALLERTAREHGLKGHRVLDVACGTGKSTAPLQALGYEVAGCDLSPAMLGAARERLGPGVDLFVADMRDLPRGKGPYDLVTCLNDSVNYLVEPEGLIAAFESVARVLRPGGIYVFDASTALGFASFWAEGVEEDSPDGTFLWRGEGPVGAPEDRVYAATIEIRETPGEPGRANRHLQRHHPLPFVLEALRAAGLEPVEVYGAITGARMELPADEERFERLVFVASSDRRSSGSS